MRALITSYNAYQSVIRQSAHVISILKIQRWSFAKTKPIFQYEEEHYLLNYAYKKRFEMCVCVLCVDEGLKVLHDVGSFFIRCGRCVLLFHCLNVSHWQLFVIHFRNERAD